MDDFSQYDDVLEHLKNKGELTSIQAIYEYGITRLSAIIYDLRKDGYNIETELKQGKNRRGRLTRYAVYKLV